MVKRLVTGLFCVGIFTLSACGHSSPDQGIGPVTQVSQTNAEAKGDAAALRANLAAHRKLQIDRLQAYAVAGIFPENPSPLPDPIHIFKDAGGRYCAVANLVHLDGLDKVVDRMAVEHNDVTVADETSGELYDWVFTSGLTREEVRRIQGAGFRGEFPGGPSPGVNALRVVERLKKEAEMQTTLLAVSRELLAATDASLEVAVSRLAANPSALRELAAR